MGVARRLLVGAVRPLLHRLDIDAGPGYHLTTDPVRQRLLDRHGVTLILDVGANAGQFVTNLRRAGYEGRVVSFEPLPPAFASLAARAAGDPRWQARNVALGAQAGVMTLHEAGNSASSSLRPMLHRHLAADPASAYVTDHQVEVDTVDGMIDGIAAADDVIFLKADVQGFEREVLEGAAATLPRVVGVELELSLAPLYEGDATYLELLHLMESAGFRLVWLERGFVDRARDELLQFDAIFLR